MSDKMYLGLDYSTQQLKSVVVDGDGLLINEVNVDYDRDLEHFGTVNGVYNFEDGVVCSPPSMWIEATDILFTNLSTKIDMNKIVAISGSAQQHTSIFWANGVSEIISNFDPERLLIGQITNIFSKTLSPSWMDTSTIEELSIFNEYFGDEFGIEEHIGSTLAKRFSCLQIMKAFKEDKDLDSNTKTITLVSNGMCSIFVGKLIGIDMSDAAGTGLQICGSMKWDSELCSIISETLEEKLAAIVPSNHVVGYLSNYFVKRYNMNPQCQIVSFTGDNPSSVVAMQLQEHDICLSLGTSDTLFTSSSRRPTLISEIPLFVFPHPLYYGTFVSLLCYKNGSQVRERLCKQYCAGDWVQFGGLIESTPAGNDGILGLFYDTEEITPPSIKGKYFFKTSSEDVMEEKDLDPGSIVRSLIEGQFLAKYNHCMTIDAEARDDLLPSISKLLVTGGASANKPILQFYLV